MTDEHDFHDFEAVLFTKPDAVPAEADCVAAGDDVWRYCLLDRGVEAGRSIERSRRFTDTLVVFADLPVAVGRVEEDAGEQGRRWIFAKLQRSICQRALRSGLMSFVNSAGLLFPAKASTQPVPSPT